MDKLDIIQHLVRRYNDENAELEIPIEISKSIVDFIKNNESSNDEDKHYKINLATISAGMGIAENEIIESLPNNSLDHKKYLDELVFLCMRESTRATVNSIINIGEKTDCIEISEIIAAVGWSIARGDLKRHADAA